MEGFFKVKLPQTMTRYDIQEKQLRGSSASSMQQMPIPETYLLLKIFTIPTLPKLTPCMVIYHFAKNLRSRFYNS